MEAIDQNIFYSPQFSSNAIVVHPGEFFISDRSDLMIITILGSCIAACIRDSEKRIGGLNHFLLPGSTNTKDFGSNRFGAYAMERLINEILKRGGRRENLEIKIFGGSSLFTSNFDVGEKNIKFIREYLKIENLKIVSEDLGGKQARKIHYWPESGKILRLLIGDETKKIIESDKQYQSKISTSLIGDVELF